MNLENVFVLSWGSVHPASGSPGGGVPGFGAGVADGPKRTEPRFKCCPRPCKRSCWLPCGGTDSGLRGALHSRRPSGPSRSADHFLITSLPL